MKRWLLVALLASHLAAPTRAAADERATLAELEKREPKLTAVRDAALRYAGLHQHPERAWSRRTRLAGLMPTLTVSINHDLAHDADVSRQSTGKEELAVGTGEDLGFEARAVWRLDRLLFDEAEVRVLQVAQRQHQERIELLTRVTSIYYQRRKLQVARLRGGKDAGSIDQLLAIEELTDQLDALTGGYFRLALRTQNR
jgi:hypothetical protein